MSNLVPFLKEIYTNAMNNEFKWKSVYPNNIICDTINGVYTDMNFNIDNEYQYVKFTIEYVARCDENCISYPDEGIKYYVTHELRLNGLTTGINIPEPSNTFSTEDDSLLVNNYGRFISVFDDEETAKKTIGKLLYHLIYPYTYILNEKDAKEWNEFLINFNGGKLSEHGKYVNYI